MQPFQYVNHTLMAGPVPLEEIASQVGTPCYVYSKPAIIASYQQFADALKNRTHQICYAVKANPSLAILQIFADLGAGFDVVSQGELARVLRAGGRADRTVFSGVGKSADEIHFALDVGIQCLNIESLAELRRVEAIAREKNCIAPIGLRINPDVEAETHPHITTGCRENKFGIDLSLLSDTLASLRKMPNVHLKGIGFHVGSQLTTLRPLLEATDKLLAILSGLDFPLEHLDLGGGLGVCYHQESPPSVATYLSALQDKCRGRNESLIFEPGRALVANAGLLLTRVEYLKHTSCRKFAIVDAGMNDFMRPALYDAWHDITPVTRQPGAMEDDWDIVGPVCESADCFGRSRRLAIHEDTLLAIHAAGAYGASMSSTYNSRPRPPEVLVDENGYRLVRARESVASLFEFDLLPDRISTI